MDVPDEYIGVGGLVVFRKVDEFPDSSQEQLVLRDSAWISCMGHTVLGRDNK